jgi:hypothetical protein
VAAILVDRRAKWRWPAQAMPTTRGAATPA